MSEENVLVPKARYEKLVADSAKGSEKETDNASEPVNDEAREGTDDEKLTQDVSTPPQSHSSFDRQDSIDKSDKSTKSKGGKNDIFLNQSPGRTVEDISKSSVPHEAIRPPGSKTFPNSETKPKNGTKKLSFQKKRGGGKKSTAEQGWIKW